MRRNPSAKAPRAAFMLSRRLLAAGVMALLAQGVGAADASPKAGQGDARQPYIVHLQSPPVALFEGFGATESAAKRALKPTHPGTAGKARLEIGAPEVRAYRKFLATEQASIERSAESALGRALSPSARLDLVLNALVLELSPQEAQRLSKLGGIEKIEPDFVREPQSDAGPAWVGAPAVWDGSAVAGVGSQGAGVVIGVIDTGINPSHPSFAGVGPIDGHRHVAPRALSTSLCASPTSPPCNGKLIGLRDFSSGSQGREADNGRDEHGHGTHVSAIAAGNRIRASLSVGGVAVEREFSGVAPHAHLIHYKACEVDARCLGSWLLAAINAAVADGVDVINYSIGGDPRDPWTSTDALALLAAREAGIVPVVAAGNAGPAVGSITSPGNAPWVISVANASHNRSFGNRLVDFQQGPVHTGASAPPPGGGSLAGGGATLGFGPARLVIPEDFPGCGTGSGLGLNSAGEPDGSSNPWAGNPNRFNGEIVVCVRGTQARLAKGDNVRRAGAGGMVLVNSIGDGENIYDDAHVLPAVHLGFGDAEQLRAWLAAGGQSARIEGASLFEDVSLADRLAADSGRGPANVGGVMLPSIAAPGTAILAASSSGTGVVRMSGTSMATPHVSGAAALLKALHPNWRVDEIQSALMGTARSGLRREDGVTPARRIDVGAGGLDVAAAARSQLALTTTGSDFRVSRLSLGGQPRDLNLPGLMHERCFERCSLRRVIRDLGFGGRWRVQAELDQGRVSVTPSEFEISAGGSQTLEVSFDLLGTAALGQWLSGEILLERVDGSARMNLPAGVFASPGSIPSQLEAELASDAGFVDFQLSGLAAFTGLVVEAGRPAVPLRDERRIAQAADPNQPYDSVGQGSFFHLLQLPAASTGSPRRWLLRSQARSSEAIDVDLFVGIDFDGDGWPNESEEVCRSTGAGAVESCQFELAQAGSAQQLWVLVQNHRGSGQQDLVALESVLLDPTPSRHVVASAPRTLATGSAFEVRLGFDVPELLVGEDRVSLLSLRTDRESDPFALIPVEFRRLSGARSARPLASGQAQRLRLAPGEAHSRLFIDLPAETDALELEVRGASPALTLQLVPAQIGLQPRVPNAPPASMAVSHWTPGDERVRLERLPGQAQRVYVRLANSGAVPLDLVLQPRLESSELRPETRFGAWFNSARGGSGLYLYPAGAQWSLLWFTYREDGTPTWYLGTAPAPTQEQAQWRVPLMRFGWDGASATGVEVGYAVLSLNSASSTQFAFQLDGVAGSEPLVWLGVSDGECPRALAAGSDPSGLWFDPANGGFGYGIEVGPGYQSVAQFIYDGSGVPRWVLASGAPDSTDTMSVFQYSGTCPVCDWKAPTAAPVGTLLLERIAGSISMIGANVEFAPPLAGSWQRLHAPSRLTAALECQL
jgi:subtilisin family serine protease